MPMATTTTLLVPNRFNPQRQNPNNKFPSHCYSHRRFTCSSVTAQSRSARENLLALISDQDRGLRTQNDPERRASIVEAIDVMAELGAGSVTTGDSLSGTWRLLWTTEKEQLFIVEKAPLFGTRAGDVLQVLDVRNRTLNNVITFPPDGVFFVRSNIEIASPQRVNFRFTSAVLRGKNWEIPLPPFGQGCPSGKLVQIEHALTAIGSGQTSLGIKAANGVVIATEKKLPSILVDEASAPRYRRPSGASPDDVGATLETTFDYGGEDARDPTTDDDEEDLFENPSDDFYLS